MHINIHNLAMARTKQTARKTPDGRLGRVQLSSQAPKHVTKRASKLPPRISGIPSKPRTSAVDLNTPTLDSALPTLGPSLITPNCGPTSKGGHVAGRQAQLQAALTIQPFRMQQTPKSQEEEPPPRPFQALTLMLEESLEDDEQLGARLKIIASSSVELAKKWQTAPVHEVNSEFERLINFVLDTAKGARQNLYQTQDNLAMRLRNGGAEEEATEIVHRLDNWQCVGKWEDLSLDSKFDKNLVVEASERASNPPESD